MQVLGVKEKQTIMHVQNPLYLVELHEQSIL